MDKPNIVLILCDQLRADVLGCYGSTVVETPNIDRLAASGVCFDRAYSQTPVCIPARHALISGKNAFELGMLENTAKHPKPFVPLAPLIRDRGYSTSAVGKMHFIPTREHFGFDRMRLSEGVPRHFFDDEYIQFLWNAGYKDIVEPYGPRSEKYYVPLVSKLPEEVHGSTWTADQAIDVIRKNRDRPFFLYAGFFKPHPPFDPCPPYDTMYPPDEIPEPTAMEGDKDPIDRMIPYQNGYKVGGTGRLTSAEVQKIRSYYYGTVTQLDKHIGRVLDALEAEGQRDNTIVILTADHGEMLGDHHGFGKRCYYEASARIPFIVSWPQRFPQGEHRQQFAILPDIYTTLVEAVGGQVPEGITGMDLAPAAMDPEAAGRDRVIAEYGTGINLKFMLRWGDMKYIYHTNGGQEELFDLAADPDEFDNTAAANPAVCQDCRQQLVAYYQDYGFGDALDGDSLKCYPYEEPEVPGYLNQYPRWPETVVE